MIITFCGHSDFRKTEEYEKRLIAFFEEKIGDAPAELYLGGYGAFDSFAFECGKKYKKDHPDISLIFVTPYLSAGYRKIEAESKYDSVIYPSIENVPKRFAISYRNKYMVERADIVVAYVDRSWGGAYKTIKYAKRKRKEIINLAE
ncbi:MAG: hypothetical protein IJZ89_00920 [Clostridia bacterium]|nr:hypothetical protein [Clostridia bacterium]